MFGGLLRLTGAVLVIGVAFATPVLATSTPASADTVVNGCTIVTLPTPTNFTNCPGADLSGTNLSGDDLDYADFAGANLASADLGGAELLNANLTSANLTSATMVNCINVSVGDFCFGADLTDANLTDANFTNASLESCASSFFGSSCGSADFTGTLLVPSNQAVTATSSAGAVVTWPTPPSLPGATRGTCTASSGSTFPVGVNSVTCQVLDDQGGVASGTFTVAVNPIPTTTSVLMFPYQNPTTVGQLARYDATVSPVLKGGTVAFTDNGSPIAGCTAVPVFDDGLGVGLAPCFTFPSTAGSHNIVATYSGYTDGTTGANYLGSTSPESWKQIVLACPALVGCNLSGINLSKNTQLFGADLPAANLSDANLSGAAFTGVNNLAGANLNDANLRGATLSGVDLADANLTSANLNGAILRGTSLSGATVNADTNFNTVTWVNTTCPDGTNSDSDGGTCIGHT